MKNYSWQVQNGLAEQKILFARKALHEKGLEVAVNVYTGSVRRLIENYTANKDVRWIMIRAGQAHPLLRFFRRVMPLSGLFKQSRTPPVLLFRPQMG